MKICWLSTVPWGGSSYSVLTKRTVPELVRLGHEVIVQTWYGLQGEPKRWPIARRGTQDVIGDVSIMPSWDPNAYGADTVLDTYRHMGCELLMSCMDVWVLPAPLTGQMRFAPWIPIDHDPVPLGVLESLKSAAYTMCYSKWGTELLKSCKVDAHYVPCSANSEIFSPMDKTEAKRAIGVPPNVEFLVTMVSANKDPSDRKGFAEGILGFADFAKRHPTAAIWPHTLWTGPINISNLLHRAGVPKEQVICPDQWQMKMGIFDEPFMRKLYCATDLLLNPAKSEGFGLPILEAQLCGTPVALTDFSTTDELLFAGYRIQGQPHWSPGAESWRLIAGIGSVVEALEAAWEERGSELLAKRARDGAMAYDTPTVAERYWAPALRDLEDVVHGAGSGELRMVTF